MTIEIKGHIKLIGELQTFNSGFTKIQIVVTTEGEFPTDIPIDFLKDKTDYLQGYGEGEQVVVSANLKGSEYNGKHYLGLNAWKISRPQGASAPSQEYKVDNPTTAGDQFLQMKNEPKEVENFDSNKEDFQDLPF